MPDKQTTYSPTSSAPTVPMDEGTVLRVGSRGPRVTTLQLRLTALRLDAGTADGAFGPKTFEAVKAFQRAKGLTADGVVGPKTAAALGLSLSAPGGGASHAPQHTADSPASGAKKPTQGRSASSSVKHNAKVLVEQYASEWSTDEEGLAKALYAKGKDAALITAAFDHLEEEYGSDADDVAVEYVELVMARRGPPVEMLKQDAPLRELLIHLLSSGTTFPDEAQAIQYLRGLAGGGGGSSSQGSPSQVEAMVQAALAQDGKKYVFGTEVKASEKNADAFDCSELVEWAVAQAGGTIPDGSQAQREWCRKHKTLIPVEEAIRTRGALLFTDTHVAISLGDGMTIEAANKKKGVGKFNATGRGWKEAGLVPGLGQGTSTQTVAQKTPSKTTGTKTASNKGTASTTDDPSAGDVIHGHVIYPNEVRAQGSIAWRNNNPGNIRNGKFTNSHGAFKDKSNRGFAIFPSHEVGFAALLALLKTSSYQPLNVSDAMKRYAPSEDSNDPVAYARTVSKMTGLDVSKTLGSLTDEELRKFAKAIQKVEGWIVGTIYPRNDPRLAEVGISIGSGGKKTTQSTGTANNGAKSTGAKNNVVIVATPELGAVGQQLTGTVALPATAHADSLKKLAQRARTRMNKNNEGLCAKGVCEQLGEAGFLYGGARPYVSTGIVTEVYDYSSEKWVSASTRGYYVSSHGHIDSSTGKVKKASESKVRSASASDSAKFMRHTLKMFKFAEVTPLLKGHGSRGTPPEASVAALRALPEGAVVVFGPAISRSVVKNTDGSYSVGGGGHAGHVGVLVREGQEVLVVADGLLSAGGKYTVELCLKNYAWAVGFVPTTAPLSLTQKDRPTRSL